MRLKGLLFAALALWLAAAPAAAQDTGSVSGVVFDQNGAPVAAANVRISGDQLPAGRTARTDESGTYRFQLLLPGVYVVEADKADVGKTTRAVVVEVSKDTQVELVLGVTVKEDVTVTAATPVVDLKSTEVNFNYKAETIETLPLQRSYSGLFQLIPGVADNGGFAPNGGGSRQDNTYLMDGVNITNPLFGYLSTEVNEFDILEFNVKRGGITAEFGRSSGFVTNAVTRSGTNQIKGGARFEMIPASWVAKSDLRIRSTEDRYVPSFAVGGPIMRDRVFFYASGRFYRSTTSDRSNNFGDIPDREESTNELFAKVTAQPSNNMFLNVGYRHRPTTIDFAGVGANDSPEVATNNEGTNRVVNANWNWFPTGRTVVDVKYLHMDEESESVAVKTLEFQPTFDPGNLAGMGSFTQAGITVGASSLRLNRQNYKRDEFRASVSQFLDFAGASHQLKAGFGWDDSNEDLLRESNGWGIISLINVTGAGQQYAAVYYPVQDPQIGIGRTYSLFVQDDITIGNRLTVNAGLLFNKDEFSQKTDEKRTFVEFGFGDEVQPRIGFNYNLRKAAGDKVYANWGRYFALDQKSTARALAPRRLFTSEARFNLAGQLLSDSPQANTVSKLIDPLDPPYQDEFLVGYATPLFNTWSLDVFYMHRDADDFIEDIPTIQPFSTFVYRNDPNADRKYKALTFELARRMANQWSMNASYSWSRLEGTYDQDYSGGLSGAAVFNTSSLINDGPGSYTADEFRNGPMSQDRSHVFKLFASYMPPALRGLTLGGYLRSQSGTPYEKRGLPRGSSATYLLLFEPAGTNRNDTWTNFDMLVAYRLALPRNAGLKLEARVLNLFNEETALLRDNRWVTIRTIPPTSAFAGPCAAGDLNVCEQIWRAAQITPTTTTNPNFGNPTAYAAPRRLLMTVQFDF
ncbi:MAG TPA: TonB-dependent receptor [Vicinamibacterales bacterium]|nr:TonB-dependent receptor [Vicinamibacterales bacterium]